jgi:hypothetical protein
MNVERPTISNFPIWLSGQETTIVLGRGAMLIIPPGAMPLGAKVRATYRGEPLGNEESDKANLGSYPVELP